MKFFKINLIKEIKEFKNHIVDNNSKIIRQIKSKATFMIKSVLKLELLSFRSDQQ